MSIKKINKMTFLKYKKELQQLNQLGKKHDKEKDPEKKAKLKEEILEKCADLKGKLHLQDLSEEETQNIIGVSVGSDSAEPVEDVKKLD